MLYIGHNASLNKLDGLHRLDDPRSWGPWLPKAEYLTQFQPVKAWELYILPHQLRPNAIEQLAEAMRALSSHPLFAELDWLSFHFPTSPQAGQLSGEISQEKWRPFFWLLKVLDQFTGAKKKSLNFHILAEATLLQVWRLDKEHKLAERLENLTYESRQMVAEAYRLRDHVNPRLGLTVENNPPYNNQAHAFHMAGLFPQELRKWQLAGVDICLDIQHASLVHWYRQAYGYDGPIPPMNALRHRSQLADFAELKPAYIHAAGAPNTPESLHVGSSIGADDDDVDWPTWLPALKKSTVHQATPIIIELVDGHLPTNWPACQTSANFLQPLLS